MLMLAELIDCFFVCKHNFVPLEKYIDNLCNQRFLEFEKFILNLI